MFPVAVIDTSFFISALFSQYAADETSDALSVISQIVENNGQLYVPQLFWYELGNVLCSAARPIKNGDSARLSSKQVLEVEQIVQDLPIYTDPQPDAETRSRIRDLAMDYELTYYDAAYLELALRKSIPLKTYDERLRKAFESK